MSFNKISMSKFKPPFRFQMTQGKNFLKGLKPTENMTGTA